MRCLPVAISLCEIWDDLKINRAIPRSGKYPQKALRAN